MCNLHLAAPVVTRHEPAALHTEQRGRTLHTDRRRFLAGASAAAVAATAFPRIAFAQTGGDKAVAALCDRILAGDVLIDPVQATFLGLDVGDRSALRAQLGPAGKASDIAASRHARSMLADLRAIEPSGLSEVWKVRREIVEHMLEQRLVSDQFDIPDVGNPYRLSQQDGKYIYVPDSLDSAHPVESSGDAEAYLARLADFSGVLREESEAFAEEASRGYLAPGWSLDLVMSQLDAQLASAPAENSMVKSLVRRAQEKGVAGDWSARAAKLLADEVYPALREQRDLVAKLRPTTREGDGLWRLPRGDEIYAAALREFTTTNLSAEEIHKTGLEQVAEISGELETILKGAGLTKGSIGERLTALNSRSDQVFPNTDKGRAALLASIRANIAAMQKKLPQAFANVPDAPLEVRRVPVEIQDGSSNGYYYPAALDGSRPAIYWINLKDTADWPKYTLPSLTYHEGNPGHHMHQSMLLGDKDLPDLLKNYFLSAYGEGWALYAEIIAEDMDGYHGLEKAGALQSWLFRAARLVADTGLHYKKWSREQATDYFVSTVGFTRGRSQREIERYCAMPGQACSYKIGQNEWVRLRKLAETELGAKFDARQFHEILKEGVMPLDMLDRRVRAWIAVQKGA
ncbi:MAG: DUF885 family protein [Novosphingobium sp.]|nr:DUF885 family protein [Novosphingobium sp.]